MGAAPAEVLDQVFWALSDATRRDVVRRLGDGDATVTELAAPYGMSLPGFMKHLRVLEQAGLVHRAKQGRVVRCTLGPAPLQEAAMWLAHYEQFWNQRLDALGRYLYHQEEIHPWPRTTPAPKPSSASSGTTRSPRRRSGGPGPTRRR